MSADRILEDFGKTVTDRPLGLGVGDEFLVFLVLLDELGLRVPNSVAIALYIFRMRVPAGVVGEGASDREPSYASANASIPPAKSPLARTE
jgi:hypothetical protein